MDLLSIAHIFQVISDLTVLVLKLRKSLPYSSLADIHPPHFATTLVVTLPTNLRTTISKPTLCPKSKQVAV